MPTLLPTATLGLWVTPKKTQAEIEADAFAMDVIQQVSDYFCFLAGHDGTQLADDGITLIPAWTYEPGADQAPIDVRMLALKVIRRTYSNPDQVIQEGNLGPIGGDRVADDAAMLFELTDAERRVLTKYNDAGDPEEGGQLWIQPIGQDDAALATVEATLYVGDDQQINLATSADPREWQIPLFSPGDPGDPNLYTD
jgi:hypothetical protein